MKKGLPIAVLSVSLTLLVSWALFGAKPAHGASFYSQPVWQQATSSVNAFAPATLPLAGSVPDKMRVYGSFPSGTTISITAWGLVFGGGAPMGGFSFPTSTTDALSFHEFSGASSSFTYGMCTVPSQENCIEYFAINGTNKTLGGMTSSSQFYAYLELADASNELDIASATIDFSFPVNGTTTGLFYYWQLETTNIDPASTTIVIVASGINSSTLSWNNPRDDGAIFNSVSSTQQVPANIVVPAIATSTYYAEAGLFHQGSGTPYASTGIISFTLDLSVPNPQNPGGTISETSSTPPMTTSCQYTSSSFLGDPIGNIQQGICQALYFLSVPNSLQQSDLGYRFGVVKASVQKKPPFGYFGSISGALSSLNFASTTSSTPVMDAMSSAALSPFTSKMDAGIALSLWMLLVVFLFHRARTIEL